MELTEREAWVVIRALVGAIQLSSQREEEDSRVELVDKIRREFPRIDAQLKAGQVSYYLGRLDG